MDRKFIDLIPGLEQCEACVNDVI